MCQNCTTSQPFKKQAGLKYHFKEHIMYFNGTLQNFKKMVNLHIIARTRKCNLLKVDIF